MKRTTLFALALLCAPLAACDTEDDNPFGSQTEALLSCSPIIDYSFGDTVTGTLTSTDCLLPDDETPVDLYRVTIPEVQSVLITMRSNELDPYLFVLSENGTLLFVDDDSDSGTRLGARINVTLPAGTYYVGANTFENQFGSYTLTSE